LKLRNIIANIIINSLDTTASTDGNLIQVIANEIAVKFPNLVGYDKIEGKLPISHPAIMKKILSSISSKLTKTGVTLKFDGSMCVLCPSDGIRKINGNKTVSYYIKNPLEFLKDIEIAKNKTLTTSQL
jgi:hypothetical protein